MVSHGQLQEQLLENIQPYPLTSTNFAAQVSTHLFMRLSLSAHQALL